MARQSRSSRPAARPAPSRPAAPQTRSATTAAHGTPVQPHHPPAPVAQAPSAGGGMMSNIISTAGGVALGSTIAHGVNNMLYGSSSAAPAEQQQQPQYSQEEQANACSIQAKDFTSCLSATNNDMNSCQWYLDQLKNCQSMASRY